MKSAEKMYDVVVIGGGRAAMLPLFALPNWG